VTGSDVDPDLGPSDPSGGREQVVRQEVLAPEPAESLAAMLDIDLPRGTGLPTLWHWIYLLERRPQRDLGPDGHPLSGIPSPPGPGRRRMFAGGRVRTHRPLALGREATRTTWIASTKEKTGRTGPLTFVTVRNDIGQDGEVAIEDEQDIVYRAGDSSLPQAVPGGTSAPPIREPTLTLEVDSRLLFRFSALTYNAHRIHYDRAFLDDEGYDDLVVHGPLQALMMGELLRRNGVDLVGREYAYRLVAPMIGPQRMTVAAAEQGLEAGAETRDAQGTISAVSTLR
jgi:3-methylfumaryl-CoA hydratase